EAFLDRRSRIVQGKGLTEYLQGSERRRLPRSLLIAPISSGDHLLGVICAEHNSVSFFRESDTLVLEAIARIVGSSIKRDIGLELIHNIGEDLLKTSDIVEVLNGVVSGV